MLKSFVKYIIKSQDDIRKQSYRSEEKSTMIIYFYHDSKIMLIRDTVNLYRGKMFLKLFHVKLKLVIEITYLSKNNDSHLNISVFISN